MFLAIRDEKELGEALKKKQDTIEIEGDLARKVIRIKATGKVAWVIALGGIGLALAVFMSTGGTGAPVSAAMGLTAVSTLGIGAATSAVAIAAAAGGVAALNTLRSYRIVEHKGDKLVLSRH